MNDSNPLSPHLQIYRWQISSLLSIAHRISGVINLLALSLIFFWLLALSFGESNYESFLSTMNSFFGKFILIGFTWSMCFHILSGIRHLAWDLGYGFEIKNRKYFWDNCNYFFFSSNNYILVICKRFYLNERNKKMDSA